jgi:hypothetical protein
MRRNAAPFNELLGLREQIRSGTLDILEQAWQAAKTRLLL